MPRSREGSGYAIGSRVRWRGPTTAAAKGAIGFVMRSAGTVLGREITRTLFGTARRRR